MHFKRNAEVVMDFKECIKKRIAKDVKPDLELIESLKKIAEKV